MHKKTLIAITGASSGIGAETARRFAKEGFPLVLFARRLDKLKELQKELKGDVSIFELDVTDKEAVFETMAKVEETVGPIHVLVNNAGVAFGIEPANTSKVEEWEQCVDTNINGVLYCTRAVLPKMVERNAGHIINLGSIAGTYPYPGGNVYGATKAFLHQFSLNLRADLLGKKIRVSCIEPGLVMGSEFSFVRFRGDAGAVQKVYSNTEPLLASDIAELIYYCHALPPHVNINTIEVMPVMQASAALSVYRSS